MSNEDYKHCMMHYHPMINVAEYETWLTQVEEQADRDALEAERRSNEQ